MKSAWPKSSTLPTGAVDRRHERELEFEPVEVQVRRPARPRIGDLRGERRLAEAAKPSASPRAARRRGPLEHDCHAAVGRPSRLGPIVAAARRRPLGHEERLDPELAESLELLGHLHQGYLRAAEAEPQVDLGRTGRVGVADEAEDAAGRLVGGYDLREVLDRLHVLRLELVVRELEAREREHRLDPRPRHRWGDHDRRAEVRRLRQFRHCDSPVDVCHGVSFTVR
jgi:hypothetical protein